MKFLCPLLLPALLFGSSPLVWELSQFSDFIKGKARGVAIARDGILRPGPLAQPLATLGESSLWSVAAAPDGSLYLGTGPRGRLYRLGPAAPGGSLPAPVLAAQLPAGHIFAMAFNAQGVLHFAASPGGQIYRLENNRPVLVAETGAKYIWSLLFDPAGNLFVGTGDEGKIFRLAPGQKPEIWYETGQTNITCLAWSNGVLLAGSDPNGLLYRIRAKGSAQVAFDAPFTEIRSLQVLPNGEIAFLAMGGAARRAQAATPAATAAPGSGVPQVTTTITVTEDAQAGLEIKPKQTPAAVTPAAAAASAATPATLEVPGLDRSALYRLHSDDSVEQVYVTKEESIYDLAAVGSTLYFLSEAKGKLFRLDADRQPALLAEFGESDMTRLLRLRTGWVAISSSAGRLVRLPDAPAAAGTYESPVHEATGLARFGALAWSGSPDLRFESRTGNSLRPDATWSDWQPLDRDRMQSPTARYLQWRFSYRGDFTLRSVTAHYLPQNQPPTVKSLTAVLGFAAAPQSKAPAGATSTGSSYTLTVTDTGEASSASSAGSPALVPTRPGLRQLILSWTAEDPDADTLQYALHFRGEEESVWKLLKEGIAETSYIVDADSLADGRYLFRITATDRPSNSLASAKSAELTSVPLQLDQTSPFLTIEDRQGTLIATARDADSSIRKIEYSIDAGPWTNLDAADGIFDSREESATVRLPQLTPGEHLLAVRVWDASLNVAIRKLLVRR